MKTLVLPQLTVMNTLTISRTHRSRRPEEADGAAVHNSPPSHVGGYGPFSILTALAAAALTLAALITRNHTITHKATKRTKAQSLGNAAVLLWPNRSLNSDQSQARWMTTVSRRSLCFLRFLLWTMNWLRLPNTRPAIFAVAMSLASFAQVFGQPVITEQPRNQTNL